MTWFDRLTRRTRFRRIRKAIQRTQRGWSIPDTWNMDQYLAGVTAGMLTHLADHAHGFPDDTHESLTAWVNDLHRHAAALKLYADGGTAEDAALMHDWHLLHRDPETDEVTENEVFERIHERETERIADGMVAMRWVADNLPALWD